MKRVAITGLILFFIILGCSKKEETKRENQEKTPIEVSVKKLSFQKVPVYTEITGFVKSKYLADISPKINGYIEEIKFKEGDYVKKGEIIAIIQNKETVDKLKSLKSQLNAAKSQLKQIEQLSKIDEKSLLQAKSNFDFAKKTYIRFKNLLKSESVTKQEFDRVLNEYNNSKLQLEKAKDLLKIDNLKKAEAESNILSLKNSINSLSVISKYRFVKAPFSGIITKKFIDKGNFINVGMPILEIASLDKQGYLYVPYRYIHKVKKGDCVLMKGGKFYITDISPDIDKSSSQFLIKIDVGKNFINGEFLEAKIKTGTKNALLIEKRYVREIDGFKYTFIVKDNFIIKAYIKVKNFNNKKYEVISGLNSGDLLIVKPFNKLKDNWPCTYTIN